MDIAVIGTGYVGLVTGAGLADFGNDVICVDIDVAKIEALKKGRIPIYEPGLEKIVSKNAGEGRLRFTTDLSGAIQASRAIFIAVGTPPKPDGSADLRYVEEVARTIAKHMNGPKLVITKSTVPIGTGRMIEKIIQESGTPHKVSIVSNPEFLREGSAIEDFMKPDRVVLGATDDEAIDLMKEIYAPLRQRLPGHEDLLHQRDRRPLRAARWRRAGRGSRHRTRLPHRSEVSSGRTRLRRFLLPEGHLGRGRDRPPL